MDNDHRQETDSVTLYPWSLRPRRTRRVECWLSEDEYQGLWKAALREDRAAASVLRQALNAYLQRRKPE